ncbi:hypothetical protein L7F22_055445 [Adiantum nelumboides]|nr:hypothetical protein [Adiantum nelumboides]
MEIALQDDTLPQAVLGQQISFSSRNVLEDRTCITWSSLDVSPKLFIKLRPKLKRSSPSKAIKKDLNYARGLSAQAQDSSSTFVATKQNDEPISDNFGSQLAIVPSLRVLLISELSDSITFCFAFKGKVLCKYGTYKIPKASYTRHLKADLIDRESKNTVTFVVTEVFVNDFVEPFDVGKFVCIEGAYVKRKVWRDGGTSIRALYANASTLIVKAESFDCCLHLYPEDRIKELLVDKVVIEFSPTIAFTVVNVKTSTRADDGDSYRLTIADGPASSDREVVVCPI